MGAGSAAATGIKMFSLQGGGGAGPFTPGPAPREAAPKKGDRGLLKPYELPQWTDILGASLLTPMNIKEIEERRPAGARAGWGGMRGGGGTCELRPRRG